jgi:hypothetical protein
MKNYNDAGDVHFDAGTNQNYRERAIDFMCIGVKVRIELKIPLAILGKLTSADFDEMKDYARRIFPEKCAKMLAESVVAMRPKPIDALAKEAEEWVRVQVCEELYNRFHLRQNAAGDAVWATPELMQDVGVRPEEDEKYLVN